MLRFAFIGFRHGHIYGLYRNVEKNSQTEVKYCREDDDESRKKAENILGAKFNNISYEDILSDESVDVIAIGDYYSRRGGLIIKALKAGKHVIADKPICTDLEELYTIERLLKEKQLKLGCMLDLRYMPATSVAKNVIQSGKLGSINSITFTGQHALSYSTRPKWYFEEGKHGGTINDIGIHGIDLVRYITGLELESIIAARIWNCYAKQAESFMDSAQFMLKLNNGCGVIADVSYSAPSFEQMLPTYWEFSIWGDEGLMRFNYENSSIVNLYMNKGKEPEIIEAPPLTTSLLLDFISEINGGDPQINTKQVIESSKATLKIQSEAKIM